MMWLPPWSSNRLNGVTDSAAFRRWFGDSVVRNADGTPKVVYHGTAITAFTRFQSAPDAEEFGFHFGELQAAEDRLIVRGGTGRIMPVYLSIQRVLQVPDQTVWSPLRVSLFLPAQVFKDNHVNRLDLLDRLESLEEYGQYDEAKALVAPLYEKAGIDGIMYINEYEAPGTVSWMVWNPTQIKAVYGNRGTYDPNDPDILNGW